MRGMVSQRRGRGPVEIDNQNPHVECPDIPHLKEQQQRRNGILAAFHQNVETASLPFSIKT
jgi:hypothetical protein